MQAKTRKRARTELPPERKLRSEKQIAKWEAFMRDLGPLVKRARTNYEAARAVTANHVGFSTTQSVVVVGGAEEKEKDRLDSAREALREASSLVQSLDVDTTTCYQCNSVCLSRIWYINTYKDYVRPFCVDCIEVCSGCKEYYVEECEWKHEQCEMDSEREDDSGGEEEDEVEEE